LLNNLGMLRRAEHPEVVYGIIYGSLWTES